MRKRNYTVTIRMNKEEYNLLQSKVKESGRTQQEVVIKAIADLKIASTEEVEELKRLNQLFADILSQLRGATTNINQIARKLHTDGEVPNDSTLYFLNKNILKYRKESEKIWLLIRRLISGQIHMSEHYVSVPEQGGGKLIPDGMCNPGQIYTVSRGKSGMIGVFRLESQMLPGNGKIERTGLGSDSKCKEAVNTAFNYLKANGNRISGSISTSTKDYIINYQDLQGIGMTDKLALPTLIALCSIALGKPVVSNLAVLGDITISGTMIKVDELANTLQVCLDSGAKKVLIPSTSFVDFASVPADLMSAFQLIPYQSAEDAVFKALGVE